jgi:hypothetical protein
LNILLDWLLRNLYVLPAPLAVPPLSLACSNRDEDPLH